MPKSPVLQTHHLSYEIPKKQKEITRKIRKGCHSIVTQIRRFKYLTNEEINTIIIETLLKQKFE